MPDDPSKIVRQAAQALRPALLGADDHKLRRILAVVEGASDPKINEMLLESVRPRLASLRPVRPLRFARLLFLPLDPLTVQARGWRLEEPAVPRSVVPVMARVVHDGLGSMAAHIEQIIAGHKTDAQREITKAGELLWPRAAEILRTAAPPEDWAETGLPLAAFRPLAVSIAAVLWRAAALRVLARSEEIGALETDNETIEDILRDIANESETGCAMIARLILARAPRASGLLRQIVATGRSQDEKVTLRQAIDRGMDAALSHMEQEGGVLDSIGQATLAEVGDEVRRAATLLREIEADQASAAHWPRLGAIRATLDHVCRARFARAVREGVIARLATASTALDATGQTELEGCARDLRKFDMAARKAGGAAEYDRQLALAAEVVRAASKVGTLTPMREFRLIEILAGADVAEALYLKSAARG